MSFIKTFQISLICDGHVFVNAITESRIYMLRRYLKWQQLEYQFLLNRARWFQMSLLFTSVLQLEEFYQFPVFGLSFLSTSESQRPCSLMFHNFSTLLMTPKFKSAQSIRIKSQCLLLIGQWTPGGFRRMWPHASTHISHKPAL